VARPICMRYRNGVHSCCEIWSDGSRWLALSASVCDGGDRGQIVGRSAKESIADSSRAHHTRWLGQWRDRPASRIRAMCVADAAHPNNLKSCVPQTPKSPQAQHLPRLLTWRAALPAFLISLSNTEPRHHQTKVFECSSLARSRGAQSARALKRTALQSQRAQGRTGATAPMVRVQQKARGKRTVT